MLIEFEGFNIKGFFASGSKAIIVNFLVIFFMPRVRIFEGAFLIGLEASISIGLIFFSDIPSNQTKLLISFQTFSLP